MPVGKILVKSNYDGVAQGPCREDLVTIQQLKQPEDSQCVTLICGEDKEDKGFWIVRGSKDSVASLFTTAAAKQVTLIGNQESMIKPGNGSSRYVLVLSMP